MSQNTQQQQLQELLGRLNVRVVQQGGAGGDDDGDGDGDHEGDGPEGPLAQLTPGQHATAVPLCGKCGVIAPISAASCALCLEAFPTPRALSPRHGDIIWIAIRANITCRSCGFPSPIEGVELDQGVDCAQCGSFQRFDKRAWRKVLAFAHAVGDLGGPDPEGRFADPTIYIGDDNPHKDVGVTLTLAEITSSGLHAEAGSGHPVCERCRTLVQVHFAQGRIETHCPACAAVASYDLPAEVMSFGVPVRGIVANENRRDKKQVRVQRTQAGLVALACPGCGASVKPPDGALVTCSYCKVIAFVPPAGRTRSETAKPITFWVAFQGPSKRRARLTAPVGPKEEKLGKKAVSFLGRGLKPLNGVELAPVRPGLDTRQLGLTAGLAALALVIGFVLVAIVYRLM